MKGQWVYFELFPVDLVPNLISQAASSHPVDVVNFSYLYLLNLLGTPQSLGLYVAQGWGVTRKLKRSPFKSALSPSQQIGTKTILLLRPLHFVCQSLTPIYNLSWPRRIYLRQNLTFNQKGTIRPFSSKNQGLRFGSADTHPSSFTFKHKLAQIKVTAQWSRCYLHLQRTEMQHWDHQTGPLLCGENA